MFGPGRAVPISLAGFAAWRRVPAWWPRWRCHPASLRSWRLWAMELRLRSVTYASGCGAGPTIRTRLRQCLDVIDPNPLQVGGINLHGDNPAGLRTPILPIQTESDSVCHEVERHIHLHVVRRVP